MSMIKFVNKLREGILEFKLNEEQLNVAKEMVEAGIARETKINGRRAYRLNTGVYFTREDDRIVFDVAPNRYIGLFFEYNDLFKCISPNKNMPKYFSFAYELNPKKEEVNEFGLGNKIKVKVLARGYNYSNEGLLLKIPASEESFYKMDTCTCLTIGLAEGAKSKYTSSLTFDEEIKNCFIEGRKGLMMDDKVYFNIKDVKVNSKFFSLEKNNDEYHIKKLEERKFTGR